jgi:hypothetical protein
LSTITVHCDSACLSLAASSYGEDSSPRILGSTSDFLVVRSIQFLVIEGVVENVLNVIVRANVTANFYDADNRSVGVLCHDTDLELIKPGQKSPFTFYWPTNSTETTYKLGLSYEQTSEQPIDVLEPRNVVNQTQDSQFIVRGEVWNGRPLKALGVSVACVVYNGNGDFSGLARTFVSSVDAGGLAEFSVYVDSSVDVGSYDLVLYAGGYEERSIANTVLFAVLVLMFFCFILFMKRRGW